MPEPSLISKNKAIWRGTLEDFRSQTRFNPESIQRVVKSTISRAMVLGCVSGTATSTRLISIAILLGVI